DKFTEKAKGPADTEECKAEEPPKGEGEKAGEKTKEGSGKDDKDKDKDKDKTAKKDDGKSKEPPAVRIDFEQIDQRILALPFPARNYGGMLAGRTHVLYLLEGPPVDAGAGNAAQSVHKFDICKGKTDKLLDNVANFFVSANGEKALYEQLPERKAGGGGDGGARPHGPWFIKAVDALGKPPDPNKPDGPLKLDAIEVYVDPRAEWKQMYREVWRIERDFFYDPNLHGADIKGLIATYQPYVDNVMSRADLSYIFGDMLGEITSQHVYISGGDRPEVKHIGVGLLGADYSIENGRYRFLRVYQGENWNPDLRAPLTEPGVNVREGEYLLAVNGRELKGSDEIYSFFQETAGKSILLKVASDASGKDARNVTVVPIANDRSLRQRAWMDANRHKVDEL